MNNRSFAFSEIGSLIFVDQIHNRGCFPSSRGSIEQQIREIGIVDNFPKYSAIVGVENNVLEISGPVFFDPWF
jgi:hypothetical protein